MTQRFSDETAGVDHHPNPRAAIGGNFPPSAIDLAAPHIEALRGFLNANPIISTDEESRAGKSVLDAAAGALKAIEAERKSLVDPLNAEIKEHNGKYHKYHNADAKRPGIWDKLVLEVRGRLTGYARMLERQRFEAEDAARRVAEETAEAARRAAEAEAEAREAAAAGVCDVDLGAAIEDAQTTSQAALRAMWTAQRAEKETKVRITGGSGNAVSLKDHEILSVTDWRAAIEEIGLTDRLREAILTEARAYRKAMGDLPAGITANYERSL